jgi:hypothetical protein
MEADVEGMAAVAVDEEPLGADGEVMVVPVWQATSSEHSKISGYKRSRGRIFSSADMQTLSIGGVHTLYEYL